MHNLWYWILHHVPVHLHVPADIIPAVRRQLVRSQRHIQVVSGGRGHCLRATPFRQFGRRQGCDFTRMSGLWWSHGYGSLVVLGSHFEGEVKICSQVIMPGAKLLSPS